MLYLWLGIAALITFAASLFDARETIIGLAKGVALEGNDIINWIAGSEATKKPTAWAVYLFNVGRLVLFAALGFVPNPAIIGISFGAMIAFTAGHIQAGLKWRYLNEGGQIDRTRILTWWQKLLGIGWS